LPQLEGLCRHGEEELMLDWSRFQTSKVGADRAFEAFSAQLFERWLRREYGEEIVSYTLHGIGGDGGVEAFARLPSGDVVGLQAKWFGGTIRAAEIKKIRASLGRAVETFPSLRRYIVAIRQNLTKGRRANEVGGVERWDGLVAFAAKDYPTVALVRWDEGGLLDQLAQPGNQELKALWFDGELTQARIAIAWEKEHARLAARYLPDLHAVGAIDKILDQDLWSSNAVRMARNDLERCRNALATAASDLVGFVRLTEDRRPPELESPLRATEFAVAALQTHVTTLLDVLATGPRSVIPDPPNVVAFDELARLLEQFKSKGKGAYTAHHAEAALKSAREAHKILERLDYSLRHAVHPRIIVGPVGCGKTHAAAAAVHRRIEAKIPCVLILAKPRVPHDGAGRLLADVLDTPGWPLARMLDGLEALAVMHQAACGAERDETGFTRALVLIDGLEESAASNRWPDVLGDLAVEIKQRPRVHLVATARTEFVRQVALPQSANLTHIDEDAEIDLPAMLAQYAREYRVGLDAVPWLGWVLRNPLEVRLLAEEFCGRTVSAAEGANANMLTLFQRKMARLEEEARSRAGANAWSENLDLVPAVLDALSLLTAEEDRPGIDDADIVAAVTAVDPEFTAGIVRFALGILHEHGLVDRYVPPADGLRGRQPEYTLATRHVSDFVLATSLAKSTAQGLKEGELAAFPTVLQWRDAATILYAARLAEQGHFFADVEWLEAPRELRVVHAQSLALLPPSLAAARRDEIVGWLVESTSLNRAILRGLVLPVSRVPDHPLGARALDEALRSLPLAQRDPIWSVPEDLDGSGPWQSCFDHVLDEFELSSQDHWDGPPLVAAWTTGTVIEQRRQRTRADLAVWGSSRLADMVLLLQRMGTVDDPQILDDCVVAALGAAIGASVDDPALPSLARLMDELFFATKAKAWTESIPVRIAARGVIERANLIRPGEFEEELARARPPYPPRGAQWPSVDRAEVLADSHFGGEIVTGDLSWYVADNCIGRFAETAGDVGRVSAETIDYHLLQAIDEGRLASPTELTGRRAAARAIDERKKEREDKDLEHLVTQLRAWHMERTEGNAEELDDQQLLDWAIEQPEMKEQREEEVASETYSDEFRQLHAHVEATVGIANPSLRAVRNGLIAHMVKCWGWSREGFAHRDWDKTPQLVDDAIARQHASATHGSRSDVCQFREKYVWAAVDRVAGLLADRMPVWNREQGNWERLANLDGLGHGMPDPLPYTGRSGKTVEDSELGWSPSGVLVEQFNQVDDLARRAELWLTQGDVPDLRVFLKGDIESWSDAMVLGFSHFRRGHQNCIDQLVEVRAFGVHAEDLDVLRRDGPYVLLNLHDRAAWIEDGVYGSPALACWAPWLSWGGDDQGYNSFSESGALRPVEVRAIMASVRARFDGDWPQEPDVWMPGPSLAAALGVAGMRGGRWLRHYLGGRGEVLATERDVHPSYFGFDHHYLVADGSRIVNFLAAEGLIPMWIVRVYREATPALFMRGYDIDPPPGLAHRSRDAQWMLIGDPTRSDPEVVPLADNLESWTRFEAGSE
jgi:hypothetical protein